MAPLKVGIVGAGIGGLSAAIALRRAGADVEVFEKSTFKNEAGAAITITPNGARILESWGLDAAPSSSSSPPASPPEASRLYASAKARAVEAAYVILMPAQTLRPSVVHFVSTLRAQFGAPMRFYHRADLHAALRIMATAPASGFAQEGQEIAADDTVLRFGTRVVDLDCEEGVVKLEDGKTVQKDLLVVADGIQSSFIKEVTENRTRLKDTGWTAYRFLIPMASVLADPDVAAVYGAEECNDEGQDQNQSPKAGYSVAFDLPKAFYVVAYPCRANEVLNVVVRHSHRAADGHRNRNIILDRNKKWSSSSSSDEDKDQWEEDEKEDDGDDPDKHVWNAHETPKKDVLKLVAPYHPALCKLVLMADDIRAFRMRRREPLERYHKGRAVLLGDAAGAVWPTHAQGSVLAIEEAAALEVLFAGITDPSLVPSRLKLYTSVLKRHIHLNQHLSEAAPGATADWPRRKAEQLWNLLGGAYDTSTDDHGCGFETDENNDAAALTCEHERKLFSHRAYNFSPEVRRFFYAFDVRAEVRRALEGMPARGTGGGDTDDTPVSGEGNLEPREKEKGKNKGDEVERGALYRFWLEVRGKKSQEHGT
ncbi:hypothetical protein F5X99DRAFT_426863 [Biscogniauxia marginata]|nr:hypothetical protein F5X99DRAFT_426863 [Biscogniauxia marginata]